MSYARTAMGKSYIFKSETWRYTYVKLLKNPENTLFKRLFSFHCTNNTKTIGKSANNNIILKCLSFDSVIIIHTFIL